MKQTCGVILGLLLVLIFIKPALANPVQIMGDESPPYMGKDLPNQGFLPAVVQEAMKRQGINSETSIVPWARAIKAVKTGQHPIILGVFFTQERTEYLAFSNPVHFNQTGLFSLKSNKIRYKKLEDLAPYKIGVVRGSSYGEQFDRATFLDKYEVIKDMQNADMLLRGRLDLFAGSIDVQWYLIGLHAPDGTNKIETLKPVLSSRALHIGFSKFHPGFERLLKQFNAGLASMIQDGSLHKLGKKHGIAVQLEP